MKLGPVTCALCGKPVDSLVAWYDGRDMAVVFEARCHGAKDKMKIGERDFPDRGNHDAFVAAVERGGVAFQQKGITHEPH